MIWKREELWIKIRSIWKEKIRNLKNSNHKNTTVKKKMHRSRLKLLKCLNGSNSLSNSEELLVLPIKLVMMIKWEAWNKKKFTKKKTPTNNVLTAWESSMIMQLKGIFLSVLRKPKKPLWKTPQRKGRFSNNRTRLAMEVKCSLKLTIMDSEWAILWAHPPGLQHSPKASKRVIDFLII